MIPSIPTAPPPLSEWLRRYLDGDAFLASRLGGLPGEATAVRTAGLLAGSLEPDLVQSLSEHHRRLDAPMASLDAIARLAQPAPLVVATGQQPGFLTGPLYTLLKAATAIALARRLERLLDRAVVPLFWVASDDHDLPEVEGCVTVDEHGELHRHRVDLGAPRPSASVLIPDGAEPAVRSFLNDVPNGPYRDEVAELVTPPLGEPWASWFSRQLLRLFEADGLVLFEPAQHGRIVQPLLMRELDRREDVPQHLARGAAALGRAGWTPPLDPGRTRGLFVYDGHKRRRIRADETADDVERIVSAHPGALSADVALRPLLQSTLFPVVAVVGGQGELAYWSQLTELFDARETPRPLFIPRLSATILEPRMRRAMLALGLNDERLFDGLATPPESTTSEEGEIPSQLSDLAARARESVSAFLDAVEATGGGAARKARDLRRAFSSSVDRLLSVVARQADEEERTARRRRRLLQSACLPYGKPQDRVLNGLPFLSRNGLDFYSRLARAIDPLDFRHRLVCPGAEGLVEAS